MKLRKILSIALTALTVLSIMLLVGCNDEPEITGPLDYTVKVVDYKGETPAVPILVEIYKGTERVKMNTLDQNGEAKFNLEANDYTFTLRAVQGVVYYDTSLCTLSKTSTSAQVSVYNASGAKTNIYIGDSSLPDGMYVASSVGVGATYVTVDRPQLSYFIFTPTESGVYQFSCISDSVTSVGYYGAPHFVLQSNSAEVIDGKFVIEAKASNIGQGEGGTSRFVIGISAEESCDCILVIEKIAEAAVELEPVNVYPKNDEPKFNTHLNNALVDFDVTDSSLGVVYNENDGYYHLGTQDGPVILLRISSAIVSAVVTEGENTFTEYKYLPPITVMCETDGFTVSIKDENGKITQKLGYKTLFLAYEELCAADGVYPLNKELADAIKQIGEFKGWWDFDSANELHIFGEEADSVVLENAWLFACCYEENNGKGGDSSSTVAVSPSDSSYALYLEENVPFHLRTDANSKLVISDAEGITVTVDGEEYTAGSNGKITVTFTASKSNPTKFYITSQSEKEIVFTLTEYTE